MEVRMTKNRVIFANIGGNIASVFLREKYILLYENNSVLREENYYEDERFKMR